MSGKITHKYPVSRYGGETIVQRRQSKFRGMNKDLPLSEIGTDRVYRLINSIAFEDWAEGRPGSVLYSATPFPGTTLLASEQHKESGLVFTKWDTGVFWSEVALAVYNPVTNLSVATDANPARFYEFEEVMYLFDGSGIYRIEILDDKQTVRMYPINLPIPTAPITDIPFSTGVGTYGYRVLYSLSRFEPEDIDDVDGRLSRVLKGILVLETGTVQPVEGEQDFGEVYFSTEIDGSTAHQISSLQVPASAGCVPSHYTVYRTKNIGTESGGIDPSTGIGNDRELFVYEADVPIIEVFNVSLSNNGGFVRLTIATDIDSAASNEVADGQWEQRHDQETITLSDGRTGTLTYVSSTVADTDMVWDSSLTFTAAPATDLITIAAGHNMTTGTKVRLTTTGTLPAGLSTGTDYYVVFQSPTTIKLASSLKNAGDGVVIDITSTGTGTHSISMQADADAGAAFGATKLVKLENAAIDAGDRYLVAITSSEQSTGRFDSGDVGEIVFLPNGTYRCIVAANSTQIELDRRLFPGQASITHADPMWVGVGPGTAREFNLLVVDDGNEEAGSNIGLQERIGATNGLYIPARFWEPLPDGNIGIVDGGWILSAQRGDPDYYTSPIGSREWNAGQHRPDLHKYDVAGPISDLKVFPATGIICMRNKMRTVNFNITQDFGRAEIGESVLRLLESAVVDEGVGIVAWETIRFVDRTKLIAVTSEPTVRYFDGHNWSIESLCYDNYRRPINQDDIDRIDYFNPVSSAYAGTRLTGYLIWFKQWIDADEEPSGA